MKRLIYICIFIFSFCCVQGQTVQDDSLSCFDYAVRLVETNYSGYSIKVNDRTSIEYISMKDSLRSSLANDERSMRNAIGCYLAWFNDYHMIDAYGITCGYLGGPIDYVSMMDYRPQNISCKITNDTYLIRLTTCDYCVRKWVKKQLANIRNPIADISLLI